MSSESWSMLLLVCSLAILAVAIPIARISKVKQRMKSLAENSLEITPVEFFRLRNASLGGRGRKHISSQYDFSGVYIIYNRTLNMYYVGQGKSVFQRVNAHLTGHGNGDIYADYRNGNDFSIKMIALQNSGYSTLNELERNYIKYYNSFSKGYNKTRGNKG